MYMYVCTEQHILYKNEILRTSDTFLERAAYEVYGKPIIGVRIRKKPLL